MEKTIKFNKQDIFYALENTYHYKIENPKIDYCASTPMDSDDLTITVVLWETRAKMGAKRENIENDR